MIGLLSVFPVSHRSSTSFGAGRRSVHRRSPHVGRPIVRCVRAVLIPLGTSTTTASRIPPPDPNRRSTTASTGVGSRCLVPT